MAVLTFLKLWAFTEMMILCAGEIKHMQNIALNKACQMSSRYIIAPGRMTGDCSAAINGDTNTILDLARSRSNCINTKLDDTSPFWSVDLGQEFSINTISIYGRANYTNRMGCVNVSLDGKVVKRFSNTSVWTNDRYDITVGRSGRVVNITKDCLADVYSINLCQVQVWVCEDGWYGDCTQVCGHCAGGSVCDKINGNCTSCQTGFQLPNCTECKDGWYGENCGETCGHCLRGNTTCDNKIGYCPSCGGAFQPPLCKEKCSAGYYGENCKQTCGHCRINTTCDPDNGKCTYGCSGGYKEGLCSECEDGWYGDNCAERCGHCVGGNSTCDKKYGSCSSCDGAFQPPLCKDTCQDGWYGKNCLERCGHCVGGNSTCDKTSGSCPSCDGSFQPPLCKESVMPSSNDKETVSLVGPVAGAAAGCSVIFFIIGGLFVCCIFRKTRSRHSAGAVRSPDEISMTFGSSIATPRSENTPDITSPENTSDPTVNVYDKLHACANDNTTAYSSITVHTDSKDTTTATEYVNITSTANDKNRYKRNQGKVVRQ